jgi:hypothetical protein
VNRRAIRQGDLIGSLRPEPLKRNRDFPRDRGHQAMLSFSMVFLLTAGSFWSTSSRHRPLAGPYSCLFVSLGDGRADDLLLWCQYFGPAVRIEGRSICIRIGQIGSYE